MAAYRKVETRMWNDERFRRMSRDARELWIYLLTSPHSNRFGFYVLDPLYAAADLQQDRSAVLEAMKELGEAGLALYDPEARVVFLKRFLKHNPPPNPNVVNGSVKELETIPYTVSLTPLFLEALRRYVPEETDKGKPFGRPWIAYVENLVESRNPASHKGGNPSGNPSPNHPPNLSPIQEQEQEQEQEHDREEKQPRDDFPEEDEPDGSDLPHPGSRMSAAELIHTWARTLDDRLTDEERKRFKGTARALTNKHSRDELLQAMTGMMALFPHCPPKSEPWDLNDLQRKFTKAKAKARDHPQIKAMTAKAAFLQEA